MKISPDIADKATVVLKDTYFGFVKFEFVYGVFKDKITFVVNTRKGVKVARQLAKDGQKTAVQCSHCPNQATQYSMSMPLCPDCIKSLVALMPKA